MTEVTRVSLENEMDIVLAQKQMMQVAGFFNLTLSTKTTISTAVAEISRVVIDRTDTGVLVIGMQKQDGKYFLTGLISLKTEIDFQPDDPGLLYARKLVPEFKFEKTPELSFFELAIGIPRSLKISALRIREAIDYFASLKPSSPYEELKLKNSLLNEQAVRKEEQLQQSRLLDEKKNEFISVASHELKTPLTSLIGFTRLAIDAAKTEGSPRVIRLLEKVDTQTKKLHLLVNQLLDVSRIESGRLEYNFKRLAWQSYFREILTTVEQMVPFHKILHHELAGDVFVNIDELRIEQVFTNVVSNAAKYSAKNSTITFTTAWDENKLTVSIADEGIGIAEENRTRIFGRYYRDPAVEATYNGFGMGLYISADIIREHGGIIWVDANKPSGSVFSFTIPVAK